MTKERNVYYENKKVRSPQDSAEIFRNFIGNADREMFVVMCLNTKNEVTSLTVAHIGSLNASVVHPREVFKTAILSNSFAIAVCHNHPSGNPTPSPEDISVTQRLVQAGQIIGIEVLDHIVLGDDKHVSLAELGWV